MHLVINLNLIGYQLIYMNWHLYFIHTGTWEKIILTKRFINEQKKITDDKLIFLKAISNVIKSGMDIVGVSVPDKM